VVICSTVGFADDAVFVGVGLLSKTVRTWLAGATGKLVTKAAGVCGLAAAAIYCTIKCEEKFPFELTPSRLLVPGLTPFRLRGWASEQ
jgi:hypothetical protein